MKLRLNLVLGSVLLVSIMMTSLVSVSVAFEVDATDSVVRVVDGDTFDTSASGRVRLADVDAPESNEPGFDEATDTLEGMIGNREVFLDIDDKGSTSFGRLICVVYVRHNSTHVLNVNKAMVDRGRAVVDDFTNNEFNPSTWTAYVYYQGTTETQPGANRSSPLAWPGLVNVLVVAVVVVVLAGAFYFAVRRRR